MHWPSEAAASGVSSQRATRSRVGPEILDDHAVHGACVRDRGLVPEATQELSGVIGVGRPRTGLVGHQLRELGHPGLEIGAGAVERLGLGDHAGLIGRILAEGARASQRPLGGGLGESPEAFSGAIHGAILARRGSGGGEENSRGAMRF